MVELDACCMHGPTRRAGSVGGVRDIKNVASLARTVMEHTGHVMLVGQGATRFGELMGFPKENLLTEHSRKIWQLWKEYHSDRDWWGPGLADPNFKFPPGLETGSLEDQPQPIQRLYALAAETHLCASAPPSHTSACQARTRPPTPRLSASSYPPASTA